MTGEMLKGHLDLLVLASLDGAHLHGYAIIDKIRSRSVGAFDLPEGTVYPVLHRLEEAKLLSSTWTTDTGRKRRIYSLTAAGRRALARRRNEWAAFSQAVSAFASVATVAAHA